MDSYSYEHGLPEYALETFWIVAFNNFLRKYLLPSTSALFPSKIQTLLKRLNLSVAHLVWSSSTKGNYTTWFQREQTSNQCIQTNGKLSTPCFIFVDEENHSPGLPIAQQGVHHLQGLIEMKKKIKTKNNLKQKRSKKWLPECRTSKNKMKWKNHFKK